MGNNKNYDKVITHSNYIENIKQLTIFVRNRKIKNERLYLESPKFCKQCSKPLEYKDRFKTFCNRSCAGTYSNINRELKGELKTKKGNCKRCSKEIDINIRASQNNIVCKECKKNNHKKYYKVRHKQCKFCNKDIVGPKRICTSCRDNFQNIYSFRCRFTFPLQKFPELFDIKLIERYGMYKAKNHGDNLDGISRDHKFSVIESFKRNLDPILVKHPANCQLLRQRENARKRHNCSITLEQLIKEVQRFEEKYNYCPEVLEYIKALKCYSA